MQAVAHGVAGSRLLSSLPCSCAPAQHAAALQSDSSASWAVRRSRQARCPRPIAVTASASSSSSSRARPFRGVVNDDIEGIPVGEYGERYLVPDHMDKDDEDARGDVRVECDSNGCIIIMPESRSLQDRASSAGYLRCDLSGCYFSPEAPAPANFEVIEGDGWRLGYETAPESESSFCAIVGAGGWSVALTGGEFDDFCTLIQTIRKGILTMDEDNTGRGDDILLQVEKGTLWMQCTIPRTRVGALQLLWQPGVPAGMMGSQLKQAFEVRFVLSGGASKRQAEGYWPADAVMDMLNKIDSLSFGQPESPYAESVSKWAAAGV